MQLIKCKEFVVKVTKGGVKVLVDGKEVRLLDGVDVVYDRDGLLDIAYTNRDMTEGPIRHRKVEIK